MKDPNPLEISIATSFICITVYLLYQWLRSRSERRTDVVDTSKKCCEAVQVIRKHCSEMPVLGFNCQWDYEYAVLLLQLCTHKGYCALIRLNCLKNIPSSLCNLLSDEDVVKVGVEAHRNTEFLMYNDIYTKSTLDLRFLAVLTGVKPLQIYNMHEAVVDKTVMKNSAQSNWDTRKLTWEQIKYAADDVIATFEIYKKLCKPAFDVKAFENYYDVKYVPYYHDRLLEHTINIPNSNSPIDFVAGYDLVRHCLTTEPKSERRTDVIDTPKKCLEAVEIIRKHCSEMPVLGFDCEWVKETDVSLLQLCTHKGYCALIRLCCLRGEKIPTSLLDLLNDKSVIKVGVDALRDARFLEHKNIYTKSTLDLRFVAVLTGAKPQKLSAMYEAVVGKTMNKSLVSWLTNWIARKLTLEEIEYAADDVIAAIEIYMNLARKVFDVKVFEEYYDLRYVPYHHDQLKPLRSNECERNMTNSNPNRSEPKSERRTDVVDTYKKWDEAEQVISKHCREMSVLGFACERVRETNVSLLKLCTHKGYCALIRLCCLQGMPYSLFDILIDKNIVKVGVDALRNAKFLRHKDIEMNSTLDLRFVAMVAGAKPQKLAAMYEAVVGKSMNKNIHLALSNWDACELTSEQIEYAADGATAAIEIYRKLAGTEFNLNKYYDVPYVPHPMSNSNPPIASVGSERIIDVVDTIRKFGGLSIIEDHCREMPVLGFDCKWVNETDMVLLQLCTHKGYCALYRVCCTMYIPYLYCGVIQDRNVIKVGVGELKYGKFFENCLIYPTSTLDLRFVAVLTGVKPRKLYAMYEAVVGKSINKSTYLDLSDWDADMLTQEQIDYAADTAFAAIEIYKKMCGTNFDIKMFQDYYDVPYVPYLHDKLQPITSNECKMQ